MTDLNKYGRPRETEHDPAGVSCFEGHYSMRCPNLFCLGDEKRLGFRFDPAGSLTLDSELAALFDEFNIRVQADFENFHQEDPRSELGPLSKVTFYWINDGSPEAYGFGLFKQGGVSWRNTPDMALVWAYAIFNDGEARLDVDKGAELLKFTPGPVG